MEFGENLGNETSEFEISYVIKEIDTLASLEIIVIVSAVIAFALNYRGWD